MSNSTASTLKMVTEYKLHELLPGCPKDSRLRASGVLSLNGNHYVVFDNRKEIAFLPRELRLPHVRNSLLGVERYDEGYEGIAYNPRQRRFYFLIEPARKTDQAKALVVEAKRTADGLAIVKKRPLAVDFPDGKKKRFSALAYLQHGGEDHLLMLCKGNRCKNGAEGRMPGGGRILVFRKTKRQWTRASGRPRRIKFPKTLRFPDYSAMAVDLHRKRFAILSQEHSEMWVGSFDPDRWTWLDHGLLYQFPRNDRGEVLYGNLAGVTWVSSQRVAVVSGTGKPNQPPQFEEKDQSIHIFDLPTSG